MDSEEPECPAIIGATLVHVGAYRHGVVRPPEHVARARLG